LATKLGLISENEQTLNLSTFGCAKTKVIKTKSTTIGIKLSNGSNITLTANIVPTISGTVHRRPLPVFVSNQMEYLVNSVQLADTIPTKQETSSIDVLIGSDYYLDIVLPHRIEINRGLYLLGSKLGWILTGRTQNAEHKPSKATVSNTEYANEEMSQNELSSNDKKVCNATDIDDVWQAKMCCGVVNTPEHSSKPAITKPSDSLKYEHQQFYPRREELQHLCNRHSELGRDVPSTSSLQCRYDARKTQAAVTKLNKGDIEPD